MTDSSDINSVLNFNYECCGMPVSMGHSTTCDCEYGVIFPVPETITGGDLSAIRKKIQLVKMDKITWYSKVSIVRT